MTWALWAVILLANNATTTWASRARNSASVPYHATASAFSNGCWFLVQLSMLESIVTVARSADWSGAAKLGIFYTCFTTLGASIAHWLSMRFLEKGKRRVGVAR